MALSIALSVGGLAPALVRAEELLPTTTTLEVSAATLQANHPITLTASVAPTTPPEPPVEVTGTVTFRDEVGGIGTDLETVTLAAGQAILVVPTLAVGTHTFRATYGGDATYAGSTSLDVVVVVTPDIVEATGVGVSPTTFYPRVDGYRDTLKVAGTRLEPLAVAIVIRNANGKTVRSASIAKAAGAYAWSWNGRNKAGTLQPAGKYTVRQTLRDGYTTKVVTKTVTLSWKRLEWRTHTAAKTLAQRSWLETGGGAAGWAFTVPRATVYGKLTASVYAKGSGVITMRLANCGGPTWTYSTCWDAAWKYFSGSTYAWRSVSKPGTKFISSTRVVRVVVAADGRVRMSKVKITLKYAVLR